ncbi:MULTISPECIES: hypothetical protein [unclassified Bacillus (in: firmicutes)]|nr:hypothetical protein [Bacillus sp. NSP9.1]
MNEQKPKQKPHPPAVQENFAKGCLFGILFSLPFWILFYFFLKHVMSI